MFQNSAVDKYPLLKMNMFEKVKRSVLEMMLSKENYNGTYEN